MEIFPQYQKNFNYPQFIFVPTIIQILIASTLLLLEKMGVIYVWKIFAFMDFNQSLSDARIAIFWWPWHFDECDEWREECERYLKFSAIFRFVKDVFVWYRPFWWFSTWLIRGFLTVVLDISMNFVENLECGQRETYGVPISNFIESNSLQI